MPHSSQIKDSLTFWIGALIPLVVVLLTNYFAARKARHERELSLRRDVYLAAVEAASAGMMAMAHLTDPSISDAEATRLYREKAPSITKVYLVANIEVVKAFTKFRDELEAALSRAVIRRLRPAQLDADLLPKRVETLKAWNQDADNLGRLFTSVLCAFRTELGLPIEEAELDRVFDEARRIRRDIVEQSSELLRPPA